MAGLSGSRPRRATGVIAWLLLALVALVFAVAQFALGSSLVAALAFTASVLSAQTAAPARYSWLGPTVLVAAAVLTVSPALEERSEILAAESCGLRPLDFDNDSAEQLDRSWFPPRVLCRYVYSEFDVSDTEWRERWWVYWPAMFALGAGFATAVRRRQLSRIGHPIDSH